MTNKYIVRTECAGVFYGEITERNNNNIQMKNARRLWYWDGAASLSELAMHGVSKPENCKFPCPVNNVELLGVIEILETTEKAQISIESVQIWSSHEN